VDFSEVGRTGLRVFSGHVYEEFLTNLRGIQGVKVYREMSDNDDIVGAALYAMERVIAQASWFIEPASSAMEHIRDADFLRECMSDMEHSWGDFIIEAASCLPYGWALLETVYKLRKGENPTNQKLDSRYNDGLIGWRKFSRRLQATLDRWDIAEDGDIRGMIQAPPPTYKEHYVPLSKSLLFRTKIDGNNPEGRSILRNSYKAYYFKKTLQLIEAIGVERDLVGIPVLTPPDEWDINDPNNADLLTYSSKLLANLRRDEQEGVMVPPRWKLSLLSMGISRRQFDVDKIINRYDKRIAVTMLAQFVMLGMERIGSFALSTDQNDFFKLAVQGFINRFAETINIYAVPRLFMLNPTLARDHKYPKFVPGNISAPKLSELSQFILAMTKANMLPTDAAFQAALVRLGRFYECNENKIGELFSNAVNEGLDRDVRSAPLAAKPVESDSDDEDDDDNNDTGNDSANEGNNNRNDDDEEDEDDDDDDNKD
jgi:hypothetical protein